MPCSQCGAENPPNTKFCVNCGAPQAAQSQASPTSQFSQPSQVPNPEGFGQAVGPTQQRPPSQVSIDFRRLGTGDIVAAAGLVLLFISLFLSWYTVPGISVSALGDGAGGWRVLILVLDILILLYLFIRTMTPRGFHLPLPHWQLLTALLGLEFLLTLLAFLVKPGDGGVSWGYGAYMGLVFAVVALAGGIMRRNEPEIVIPGVPRTGFSSFRSTPQPPQMGATPGGGAQGTVCSQCGSAVPPGTPYCTTCGAPTG
jgi:zinc-ribbon domain